MRSPNLSLRRVLISAVYVLSTIAPIGLASSAHAGGVTCVWLGAAGDHLFSNSANWSAGCTGASGIPGSGDAIGFDNTTVTDVAPTNDLTGLSLASINFYGTGTSSFTITGNPLILTAGISDSSTNGGTNVNLDITLGADAYFMSTGSNLGNYNGTNTIALAGHTLTLSDASNSYGSSLDSVITDTGNILVSSGSWNFNAVSPNWSGNLNVASASAVNVVAGSLGTASVVEAAGGVIRVCAAGNTTLSNAFSLAQTGTVSAMGFGSCGAPTSSYTLTLSGALTLTSNVTVNSNGGSNTETFLITGPLSGAYTLTSETGSSAVVNIQSSNNTSNSPNTPAGGSSGIQTITYSDSQPGTSVTVANNQKVLVDGTRGNITVQSGGILGGHGTVGTVSVQSGGTLAPGNSPGCLASGNVTLVSGANYNVDIAGATACTEYDQEVVTGTVDLGSATLNLNLTYVPVAGAKFKIIDNDAADAIVGTFAGLTDGATVTANGYNFTISYLGGDGNDVELTAVGPVVVPALPAAAHSTGTAPILLALLAMLGVIGIEIGRRARARR